jgi:hypothetical protein
LDDCDEWCVGLPLTGVRALDSAEIESLSTEVLSQYRRHRNYAVTFASVFAVLYLSTVAFFSPALFWLTAADGVLITIFVLWLVSDPHSWLRRYRALQADTSAGVVHCFHHAACAGPLEVLPRSEIVYFANDFSPKKWRLASITSTAKTPPFASIASEWLQPVEGSAGRVLAGKRALSVTEKEEINRAIQTIWNVPKRRAVSYIVWMCFVAWLWRTGSHDLLFTAILLTGYSAMKVAPAVSRAVALRQDIELGQVVINQRSTRRNDQAILVGPVAEYLPHAKVKWTDGGQPAEWRKGVIGT